MIIWYCRRFITRSVYYLIQWYCI